MIPLEACHGCTDDFYNGHNELGVKRCWHAEGSRVVTRYRIGIHTLPTTPGAFAQVKVPTCYRQKGQAFTNRLPDFVRLEDVVGGRAAAVGHPDGSGTTTADSPEWRDRGRFA